MLCWAVAHARAGQGRRPGSARPPRERARPEDAPGGTSPVARPGTGEGGSDPSSPPGLLRCPGAAGRRAGRGPARGCGAGSGWEGAGGTNSVWAGGVR